MTDRIFRNTSHALITIRDQSVRLQVPDTRRAVARFDPISVSSHVIPIAFVSPDAFSGPSIIESTFGNFQSPIASSNTAPLRAV